MQLPETGDLSLNTVYQSDALTYLRRMPDESVHCLITSPPYFRLRNYMPGSHTDKQREIGLETTPDDYATNLQAIFHEAQRVLRRDGSLWIVIDDTHAANRSYQVNDNKDLQQVGNDFKMRAADLKVRPKSLMGIPWRMAFKLMDDNWILRMDILWEKVNAKPESVKDRVTRSHEYLFHFSRSEKYWYDPDVLREPHQEASKKCAMRGHGEHKYVSSDNYMPDAKPDSLTKPALHRGYTRMDEAIAGGEVQSLHPKGRNKRSVWKIPADTVVFRDDLSIETKTQVMQQLIEKGIFDGSPLYAADIPYEVAEYFDYLPLDRMGSIWTLPTAQSRENHFAAYPEHLVTNIVLAACPRGGVVCDPFMGTGTTALAAQKLDRQYTGCDLYEKYVAISERRLAVPVNGIMF